MRPSSIVMLAVALVLGISAALLSKIWLQAQVSQPQIAQAAPSVEMGTVVLAAKSLRFGNRLSARSLQEVEWPSKAIPKGAFTKISDVVNGKDRRVVLSSIEANEPVLGWKITGPGQRASLSALISEGMKAVTIRVNDVLGVAGFVLPGERVDVLLTRTETQEAGDSEPLRKNAFTDVLLQNARVLAVDQMADDRTEEPTPAKAVTIEVTTEQAQKLMLASSVGQLALALRSAGSTSGDASRRIAISNLNTSTSAPASSSSSAMVIVTREVTRSDYSVPRASQQMSN